MSTSPSSTKALDIARHPALHVAEVDVGDRAHAGEAPGRLVDVALGHLGQRADAELERVRRARRSASSRSYLAWLLTSRAVPRSRSTGGSSGCAASRTPASSATGTSLGQEPRQPVPELRVVDRDGRPPGCARRGSACSRPCRRGSGSRASIAAEVEDGGHGAAARQPLAPPAPDAGKREVVADHRNAGAAGVADEPLHPLDLRRAARGRRAGCRTRSWARCSPSPPP